MPVSVYMNKKILHFFLTPHHLKRWKNITQRSDEKHKFIQNHYFSSLKVLGKKPNETLRRKKENKTENEIFIVIIILEAYNMKELEMKEKIK